MVNDSLYKKTDNNRRHCRLWLLLCLTSILVALTIASRLRGQPAPTSDLPNSATDIETSDKYNYVPHDCENYFTDIAKRVGYPLLKELASVAELDDSYEVTVGSELAEDYKDLFGNKLDVNQAWLRYVSGVGQNLVRGVKRKTIEYHFHVVDSDTMFAFSVPGGVFIYRGLLDRLDNEAELAFILAHEIGHIDLRHCIALTHFMMNLPGTARKEKVFVAAEMVKNSFQTEIEIEADNYGLSLCHQNNYSPYQAVRLFLTVFNEGLLSRPPTNLVDRIISETRSVLDTHPHINYRVCLIRNRICQLEKESYKGRFYLGKQNYKMKIPMQYGTY